MFNDWDITTSGNYGFNSGSITGASLNGGIARSSSMIGGGSMIIGGSSGYAGGYAGSTSGYANSASFRGSSSGAVNQIASDLIKLTGYNKSVSYTSNETFLSAIEQAILRSTIPIDINETEEISVNGERGIWANKAEVINWRGAIPIEQYLINQESNPEIINKKSALRLEYIQELAIRYLRPPTPPAPGEIIIKQEANIPTAPAPPLIIRQQPPRPATPEPLIIREAPPLPPSAVGRKLITISGKRIPPPPRKVVIERLPALPSKPQSIFIERWLPYAEVKRRVVFQPNQVPDPVVVTPRNVIVQWMAPDVNIKKEYKYLGVIRANPSEYVSRYGSTLKSSSQLPNYVLEFKTPDGLVLAADYRHKAVHDLEGDIHALGLIDLDREGLSDYRHLVQNLMRSNTTQYTSSISSNINSIIAEIFSSINLRHDGRLTKEEAEKVLLKLNSRFGRGYGEDEVNAFFQTLDVNSDGSIDLQEFQKAFESLI